MTEQHELMGGKLHIYKRENSRFWQCSTYLAGKNRRMTTKEESLSHAKEIAEDWYHRTARQGARRRAQVRPKFNQAAEQFLAEYELITQGQRSPHYVQDLQGRAYVRICSPSLATRSCRRSPRGWCRNIASIANQDISA